MRHIANLKKILRSVQGVPFLLFLLSFFVSFSLMSKGPYHVDVLDLMIRAEHLLKTGQLLPLFGSGYPLSVILAAGSIKGCHLVGVADPAFAVNLVGVVFGTLSVMAFYYLARAMFGGQAAVASALLFSVRRYFWVYRFMAKIMCRPCISFCRPWFVCFAPAGNPDAFISFWPDCRWALWARCVFKI